MVLQEEPSDQSLPGDQKSLAMTTTGEVYQPVRLHYEVTSFGKVFRVFGRLECIAPDPENNRWVWLYTDEARSLRFEKEVDEQESIVLGSFLQKGKSEMVLDVRSIERAWEAVLFFDAYLPSDTAKVTEASIVNRLFDAGESTSPTFDHLFDSGVVVDDPKAIFQEIEQIRARARNKKEKRALVDAYLDEKTREPLPERERFLVHFYREGIESLQMALRARQVIALQHWSGNADYGYVDYIHDLVRQRG